MADPLLLATGNPGKVSEFEELLEGTGICLDPYDTGAAETGDSYEANAAIKAEAAARATGRTAIGDDSGLEVEVLEGFPGLYSARVAPTQRERNRLLLDRLEGRPRPWRARFVCVLALARPGMPVVSFRGEALGEIVEPRGAAGGFGYDPLFLVPQVGRTFAEMEGAEKHRFSHRGAAVRALLESRLVAVR